MEKCSENNIRMELEVRLVRSTGIGGKIFGGISSLELLGGILWFHPLPPLPAVGDLGEYVISAVFVAVGTSLPELVTVIQSLSAGKAILA